MHWLEISPLRRDEANPAEPKVNHCIVLQITAFSSSLFFLGYAINGAYPQIILPVMHAHSNSIHTAYITLLTCARVVKVEVFAWEPPVRGSSIGVAAIEAGQVYISPNYS
jgi:hypothetical protein